MGPGAPCSAGDAHVRHPDCSPPNLTPSGPQLRAGFVPALSGIFTDDSLGSTVLPEAHQSLTCSHSSSQSLPEVNSQHLQAKGGYILIVDVLLVFVIVG